MRAHSSKLAGYRFPAFGGEVKIEASGPESESLLLAAAGEVEKVSRSLTRFDRNSALCRLNDNPNNEVEVEPLLLHFIDRAIEASRITEGLINPTLLPELEAAGYRKTWSEVDGRVIEAEGAKVSGLPPGQRWREVFVDRDAGTVTRPPGVRFDAGGIGKGMAADLAAETLLKAEVWSVDCLGDVLVGGGREVAIASPDPQEEPLAILEIREGAVATSGTTRRSWAREDGSRAHHLIDPRTGKPARSDLVQVSALAPTAVEAEARAKAALLAGIELAPSWLPHGGVALGRDGQLHHFQASV